jgi:MoaA/NifB/PqqE/SkfB family radical SAM enzyme
MKCRFAWSHLDFKKNGYAPCFRFKNYPEYWKLSGSDKFPSQVINNSDFISVRQQLRNDEWPKGCIDCKRLESEGLSSYRTRSLQEENDTSLSTEKAIFSPIDYRQDRVKIKDLQLKLSRACNYNCRHCDSASNSSFEKLGIEFPEIEQALKTKYDFSHISKAGNNKIVIPTKAVMDDLFENVFPTVEQLEFSGGEPFYQIEMYKTLQRLIDDPNINTKKIYLVYNSNMSMLEYKGYSVKKLFPHFRAVSITASMDGTGKLFNYFRTGGDYQNVVNNIKELAPYVHSFLFVCTTSAYQAFYMNEIYRDLRELQESIPNLTTIRTTFVNWPKALDIINLEEETKNKIMENLEINDFTREFAIRLTSAKNEIKPCFKGLIKTQDLLYDKSCQDMAPKIWEYACS